MSQNPNEQHEMTAEEQNRQQWQPAQYWQEAQQGYNQWPPKQLNQLVPTTVVVRLSDEDVERIAEAVVRALGKADYPR